MATRNLNAEQITNIATRIEKELGEWRSKELEYSEVLSVITTKIRKEKPHLFLNEKANRKAG